MAKEVAREVGEEEMEKEVAREVGKEGYKVTTPR